MIVVVVALPEEASPLRRRLAGRRTVAGAVEGRLGGETVRLLRAGPGARRARAGIERALGDLGDASSGGGRLILAGVAGGLDPELELGEVVTVGRAARLVEGAPRPEVREVSSGVGGIALTVDAVVTEVADKRDLWTRLGEPPRAVVDMETFHWLAALDALDALAAPPAVTVLRAVSDTASTALPAFLADALGTTGEISRLRVAAAAATRPLRVGELLRLRRDVALAAARLADAVENLVAIGGGQ